MNLSKIFKLSFLAVSISFAHSAFAEEIGKIETKTITAQEAAKLPTTPQFLATNEIQTATQPTLPQTLKSVAVNDGVTNPVSLESLDYGAINDEDLEDQWLNSQLYDTEKTATEEQLPMDLASVLDYDPVDALESQIEAARYNMISQAAVTFGTQAGYARQLAIIKRALSDRSVALENIYNFQRFMLPSNVLPPVIAENSDLFEQSNDDEIHVGNLNYRILSDARLVYGPPSWKSYLLFTIPKVAKPHLSLNKDMAAEKKLWNKKVAEGYRKGVRMANRNLYEGFRALNRDFIGVINYHILQRQGIVSLPYVTVDSRDIVGNNRDMTIGDTVLRIAVKPEFIMKRSDWAKHARSGQKGYIAGKGQGADVLPYVESGNGKSTSKSKKAKKKRVAKKAVKTTSDAKIDTKAPIGSSSVITKNGDESVTVDMRIIPVSADSVSAIATPKLPTKVFSSKDSESK